MKKTILISFVLAVLLISGCEYSQEDVLEKLQETNSSELSEYERCVKEVEKNQEEFQQCIRDGMNEKGYDPFECGMTPGNSSEDIEKVGTQEEIYYDCLVAQSENLFVLDQCIGLPD